MITIHTTYKQIFILFLLLTTALISGCLPANYSLTTQELAKAWMQQGPEDTIRKYSGKTVELSGVVAAKTPLKGDSEVTLLLYENSPAQLLITVSFPPDRFADIAALKQGSFITVKGTFYGVMGSKNGWNTIVINNAKLVE
ncbi:MAG TPA: hypothetical protein VN611_08955 [Patescibacteria group bacterium]|nr:hypothetical protein [Patescibacteria group bacterium]